MRDSRINPNLANFSNGFTPLSLASQYGHLNVVNRLLDDPRVDPSIKRDKALRDAVRGGHLNIVNRLLEDPRVNPNEALHNAIFGNNLDIVLRFLQDPRTNPHGYDLRPFELWNIPNPDILHTLEEWERTSSTE